jgi:copper chaperone CopZ
VSPRVYVVPALVAALAVGGVLGAAYINVPTLTHIYDADPAGATATAVFTVEGVKCHGTADYLREHIESLPGLVSMVAYAGKHRVVIEYSPSALDIETIIKAIEAPISVEGEEVAYFKVVNYEKR